MKPFRDNEGKEVVLDDFILYVTETRATVYKILKIDVPYIYLLSLTSGHHLIRLVHELDPCYVVTKKIHAHYKGQ